MSFKENVKNSKLLKPIYLIYKRIQNRFSPSQDKILDQVFEYYKYRFTQYSGAFSNGIVKDEAYIFWLSHVIEKGLAMPNMRLGFGTERVKELATKLESFANNYSIKNTAYQAGVDVLNEYNHIHKINNYELSKDVIKALTPYLTEYSSDSDRCVYTPDTFFINLQMPFDQFSINRHTIRDFSLIEDVEVEELLESIKLASYAPSACNRQPARVHIISDKESIKKCLSMQNGNRGFGDLANKLLIVTGDLQTVLGAQEFFDLNTNIGIFIMNLSYSLYFKKIAHCILNWYAMPKEDKLLRKLVGIPEQENIVALIVCGKAPKEFKVAISPRKEIETIATVH